MDSREMALDILLDIEKNQGYSNQLIAKHIRKNGGLENENFTRELVYGVLENKRYLDYMIRKKSSIRLKKIHPLVLMVLRLGSYQLVFLDRIPESALVNESVKLVKKKGLKKSGAFVNAILRNMIRDLDDLKKIEAKDDLDYLAIRYSYPNWMIDLFDRDYGYDFTKDLCKANAQVPKLNLRVNSLKITRDELKEKLEAKGFIVRENKYSIDGLSLENPRNIIALEEFKRGYFTIQDESSQLVSQALAPEEGSLVLDMCSAPGGKACHLGELMGNKGRVLARDIYSHKIDLIDQTKKRLGVDIVESELYDALDLDENLLDSLDYLLLDAPCSALGNIRRTPEIKWHRKEEDLGNIVKLQEELLDRASSYIGPGGVLLYSTCTVNKDENIRQVEKFLASHEDFYLESIPLDGIETSKGIVELYPNIHGTDGFFMARLKRMSK